MRTSEHLYYSHQTITAGVVCLLVAILLSACSSSSTNPTPGTDGDWEAADLMDSDPDTSADGDTDTGDSPADCDESDMSDSDGDAEDAIDGNEAEEDIEYPELPEQEEREPPEMLPEDAYSTYSLLDRAELRSCDPEVTMDSPEFYWAVSVHRGTDGVLYFGNRYGLWRLEESPSEALVCVPGIEETVWSITSRRVGDSHELWVGLDGRAGVLRDDTWEFIDVPQEWKHEDADYNGPLSSMVWKVEVNDQYEVIQTTQGVAFRRGSGGFQIIDWCPEGALLLPSGDPALARKTVASSQWASILLSSSGIAVGGKQAIYSIDLTAQTCSQRCSTALDGHYFVVTGENEAGLWAMHARPGTTPLNGLISTEPYTQELELGRCTGGNMWQTTYTPPPRWTGSLDSAPGSGVVVTGWTYIAGSSKDQGMGGIFMAHTCNTSHMFVTIDSGSVKQTDKILLDHAIRTGWRADLGGFFCYVETSTQTEWSSTLFGDFNGYWYSPGFTRIEIAE